MTSPTTTSPQPQADREGKPRPPTLAILDRLFREGHAHRLTPGEFTVLMGYAYHADKGFVAWPSAERLAGYFGMTDRQVRRLIKSLGAKGFLVTVDAGGGRTSARRRVVLPPMAPQPADADLLAASGSRPTPDESVTGDIPVRGDILDRGDMPVTGAVTPMSPQPCHPGHPSPDADVTRTFQGTDHQNQHTTTGGGVVDLLVDLGFTAERAADLLADAARRGRSEEYLRDVVALVELKKAQEVGIKNAQGFVVHCITKGADFAELHAHREKERLRQDASVAEDARRERAAELRRLAAMPHADVVAAMCDEELTYWKHVVLARSVAVRRSYADRDPRNDPMLAQWVVETLLRERGAGRPWRRESGVSAA